MSQTLAIGEKEYAFFEKDTIVGSLGACERVQYSPLFMPEQADLWIAHPELFKSYGRSVSIHATGTTSAGSPVEIYAHIPGEWSERQYISYAVSEGKLINYALPLTQQAFDALEKRNGETDGITRVVTVMDHKKANKARFGEQSLDDALENPHVPAFFGSEERAEAYLNAYQKVWGNRVHIWHSDDLRQIPVARPLVLNSNLLGSSDYFNSAMRVPGVCRASVREPVHAESKGFSLGNQVSALSGKLLAAFPNLDRERD